MAESRSPGRRPPAPRDRRLPTRRCDLTLPLEHFPAPRAGRMVRDRGAAAPQRRMYPCPLRFADDAVMAFENFLDAKRVLDVLGKRFARYGLSLHPDKTRFVDFRNDRPGGTNHPETNGTSFTFLGFAHIWGKP